jgi:hypothetical protein
MYPDELNGIFAVVLIVALFCFWCAHQSDEKPKQKKHQWIIATDTYKPRLYVEDHYNWFNDAGYTNDIKKAERFDSFDEVNEILNRLGVCWFAVRA